jgi:TRAP-type C4-dicarboxylate transport system substrate-binding protein
MKSAALSHVIGTLAVAGVLAAAAPVDAFAQETVTLKAVTAWSRNFNFNDQFFEWIKRVNDRGAGKVRIDYVGGPEVYPSFEQLEPLKRGVFSAVVTSTAYVAGALPELNATWFGFGATPRELRAAGLVAALDKVTREKHGVMVLGLPLQMRFNVYLKRPIEGANLGGLKMRSTPIYEPVLKGLGAATVTVPPSDLLTALETGLVDGFAWPAVAVTGPGYARAIKHKVTPPWWVGTDVALMNARAFDALSEDRKKILIDAMVEVENGVFDYYLAKEKEEDAVMARMGIQSIPTSDADLQKIRRIHWDAGTEAFLVKPSPKYGPDLMKVIGRYAPK